VPGIARQAAPASAEKGRGAARCQGRRPAQDARLLIRALDPAFWKDNWREALVSSPAARRDRYGPAEELAQWDRRAEGYARQSESPESRAWRSEILRWLAARGALESRFRVLDIGAGPGNFALHLAARVRQVTALEPAPGMAAILRRRKEARDLRNLRVVERGWGEVRLEREGWAGAFDLVFASMSPGVDGPEALERMLGASRRFCYLSGWSGGLWGQWGLARRELWPILFAEQLGPYPNDVLYAFGLLYARGLRPELRFRWQESRHDLSREEAEEELGRLFERYTPLTPAVRRRIAEYVHERTRGGRFRQAAGQCQGFLLWEVEPALSARGARARTRAAPRSRSRRSPGGRRPGSDRRTPPR
jgi:SAM-dependent methyltransferase